MSEERHTNLYTDQMHLKRVLRGGIAAMTALTDDALQIIDPAFVPGMGAIKEDRKSGMLKCPVIGCGRHFVRLAAHLGKAHAVIGGEDAVRKALDIPKSVALTSYGERANAKHNRGAPRVRPTRRVAHTSGAGVRQSLHHRNLRQACDAQLAHRLTDLANDLGRSPSLREFTLRYGGAVRSAVLNVYGSWNAALAASNLRIRGLAPNKITSAEVLPAIHAWYRVHGDLPLSTDTSGVQGPALPAYATILRAFNVGSWPAAMHRAAAVLDIQGGRYGLPIASGK